MGLLQGKLLSVAFWLVGGWVIALENNVIAAEVVVQDDNLKPASVQPSFCSSQQDHLFSKANGGNKGHADDHSNGIAKSVSHRLREFILDAILNGSPQHANVQAICLPDARLVLLADDWRALHLRPVADTVLPDGRIAFALEAVAGLSYQVDVLKQTIAITVPVSAFDDEHIEGLKALDPVPPPPPPGGYLTYNLTATAAGKQGFTGYGASLEGVTFNGFGLIVGNGFVSSSNNINKFVRNETYWQRQLPGDMTTLTFGDNTGIGGSWSRPIRFAGIRYARDFGTRPGFITMPMPSLSGSAALPSTVDVLINNQQRLTTNVPAGPFDITNVPIISGAGQMQLVVRDLLGRETIISQDYYMSQQLLATGLSDFSYEAGFQRKNFGVGSFDYGDPIADGTYRWGINDRLTTEVRGEVEKDRAALGIGGITPLADLGVINTAAGYAVSRGESGGHYLLGFSSFGSKISFNFGGEYFDPGYSQFAAISKEIIPKERFFAGGGLILGQAGSLSASYNSQSNRDGSVYEFVSGGWSKQIGLFSFGLSATDNLSNNEWTSQLFISMPIDGKITAAAGVTMSDRFSEYIEAGSPVPNGNGQGFGWRLRASENANNRFLGSSVYNTRTVGFTGDFSEGVNGFAARVGAAGTLGALKGYGFASRPITNGFAIVRTGDVANVPVQRWNQLEVYTGEDGVALITNLNPYQPNKISIDPAELPLDVEIDGTEIYARPWPKSGVFMDFPIRRTRSALVILHLDNGDVVPHGARVMVQPGSGKTRVAKNGEVWLTDVTDENRLYVEWKGGACEATVTVPKDLAYGAKLGPVTCAAGPKP